ncbi:cyclin-d4-1 [Phtheirospermum japonicum]|uniref:Cyclin-d4-1 n=1 Tax=Phtheirospermum japonicum TaxID=374723 RepID=A0A830C0K7_9LAMI|nr:cyclin-d4-1 [Phtheirospermum japonicum]
MAETKNIFDRGATDLLCNEETQNLCFFDDGDLLEPFDDQSHQTNGVNGINGGSESEPLISLPCLSEDSVGWMLERESEHLPRDDYLLRLRIGELDMGLRREAHDWMIKACAHHNFGELCLYLAMSYLDRFLSVYNLPVCSLELGGKTWAIHLAAVTCLSLAAKIDEVNVPNTVNLQAGEPKFLFEGKTIKRMEILVLNYLKWNIKPYTPLNFVEYFLRRMNDNIETPQRPLFTRSIQIILSTIKGIDFLEFKPSELAAAVAVYVSGENRAMDIDKALSSFLIIEKGRVMKCLELIQDLISSTNVANGSILSSSFCRSPNGVLDAACLSYKSDERKVCSCPSSSETSPNKKRRRLDQKTDLGGDS